MTRTRLLLPFVALLLQSACVGTAARSAPAGALAMDTPPALSADDRTIIRTSELTVAVETLDSGRTAVLAVVQELSRVQGELDGLEAQLRVLRDRAAMSTLSVELEQQVVLGPVSWVLQGAGRVVAKLFVWR